MLEAAETPHLSRRDAPAVFTPEEVKDAARTITHRHSSIPFEAHRPGECNGDGPLPGYPIVYPVMDVMENWPPDNPEIPGKHYDSLCHFDYGNPEELERAMAFRNAQVPFVAYNIPMVNDAVERWSDPTFLWKKFSDTKAGRVEMSANNHFMYYNKKMAKKYAKQRGKSSLAGFPHPEVAKLTFDHWLHLAVSGANATDHDQHFYFLTDSRESPWLFDELPMFRKEAGKSLLMAEPEETHGIFCRFGMRGCIAENHYDGARNFVAVLGGQRRYVLSAPDTCEFAYLLPSKHPAGRHSAVDWSDPDLDKFPKFAQITANEVILQEGDVLYIPTYWHHYIVSLDTNWQCNSRSGISAKGASAIQKCGFKVRASTDGTRERRRS